MLRLQEGLNKKKAHMEKSIQVTISLRRPCSAERIQTGFCIPEQGYSV